MSIEIQAAIAHHIKTSKYWADQPKIAIAEAFAEWIILTAARIIVSQYTGGATMNYMAMLKAFKEFVIAAGVEDDICQWLEGVVADSSNTLDDYVLAKVQEFWQAL